MFYRSIVFPLLRRFDAEGMHEGVLSLLATAQDFAVSRIVIRLIAGKIPSKPVPLFGLNFPNYLGVAAGYDKDVRVAAGLAALGFGHVEVGTLTPRPQVGNPRPRLFRLVEDGALINRMGFPNGGIDAAVSRLRALNRKKRSFVLGVSLGMQKETELADAGEDYTYVMRAAYPFVDYLAVNVSSPNTPGLRKLQSGRYLNNLLRGLREENEKLTMELGMAKPMPLLLKISPNLSWAELDELLEAASSEQVDGIIATNTSLEKTSLSSPQQSEVGGLSGIPIRERSNQVIAYVARQTAGKLPIIGVGGIRSADDVKAKLDAGASLVQIYTGLVYEGPGLAGRILRELV